MCFSAGASFTSGLIIGSIGIATGRKVTEPSQRMFASVPMLFAFQQFAEGVLWITIRDGNQLFMQKTATYLFLLMALIIWPSLIPLAVRKLEENRKRRRIITGVSVAGITVSLYYIFCLVMYNVRPDIRGFHVQYVNDFPDLTGYIAFGLYVVATIAPLFISTVRKMNYFGYLITFSIIVTGIFYREYLTSVWCFFAALISGVIYVIVSDLSEDHSMEMMPA